jgi:hypothetical protein
MYVRLEQRSDGMPDQTLDCERVVIDQEDGDDRVQVTVEFDEGTGENGELRVIVDDECVYSNLVGA